MSSGEESPGKALDDIGLGEENPTETLPAVDATSETADTGDGDSGEDTKKKTKKGWAGTRLVALVAVVAVVALLLGAVLMRFVISPAELAARTEPPEAGPVSVPIESREIRNTVTIRGEVTYADSVEAAIEVSGMTERPVVTGRVPEMGAILNAGDIALEVAGRPVVVMPGELPVFRTLSIGMKGPDVVQLKQALAAMGYEISDVENNEFDASTANAIAALYDKLGYAAPTGGEEAQEALKMAQEGVRTAETGVEQAKTSLTEAKDALKRARNQEQRSQVVAAENALAQAERELKAARNNPESTELEIASLRDAVKLAKVQLDEAKTPPDTSAERAAVTSSEQGVKDAERTLKEAKDSLAEAQRGMSAQMPAEEVMYLSNLPRRVDYVNVARGDVLSGSAMSVSGATLQIKGTAAPQDAEMLREGTEATFQAPDGTELPATVTSVKAPSRGGSGNGDDDGDGNNDGGGGGGDGHAGRWEVLLEPGELTSEQIEMLRMTNVRVSMAVASTDGEVLAVPIAALSAGTGGESRVELAPANPDDEPVVVPVTTGLSAEGYVEITSDDERIAVGTRVVVGR